jgi:Phosphotransferase enzyme family
VLDAAAQRLAELGDLAGGGEVLLHGDFYLGNVLAHGGHVSALIDLEFSRMGPRDLELISVVRALDAETRLGLRRPPLLAWLAEDYPELFGAADLHRRLWLYALAYTIRQIIFWPPDRAEADGLELTHPLRTLRRLIDAPLPLPAADLPLGRKRTVAGRRPPWPEAPASSGGQWCPRSPDQRGHGRDVQDEKKRHGRCRNQRERKLADRRTGRCDVEQLESGEGAEGQGHDQIGHAERVEPQGGAQERDPRGDIGQHAHRPPGGVRIRFVAVDRKGALGVIEQGLEFFQLEAHGGAVRLGQA